MSSKSPLKSLPVFLLIAFTSFTMPAHAKWEKVASGDFTLPNPPGDADSRHEIAELLKLQDERTQAECDAGTRQLDPEFKKLFGDSPLLTKQEIATLAPLMDRVSHFGERVAGYFKSRYRRTRPYNFDPRVQPCVVRPGGSKSYPSSHATVSTLDACVLGLVFPAYQKDFSDLGVTLSERRMKIGVHFPSDVRAGQNLAGQICDRLQQESDFMNEISKLRRAL